MKVGICIPWNPPVRQPDEPITAAEAVFGRVLNMLVKTGYRIFLGEDEDDAAQQAMEAGMRVLVFWQPNAIIGAEAIQKAAEHCYMNHVAVVPFTLAAVETGETFDDPPGISFPVIETVDAREQLWTGGCVVMSPKHFIKLGTFSLMWAYTLTELVGLHWQTGTVTFAHVDQSAEVDLPGIPAPDPVL